MCVNRTIEDIGTILLATLESACYRVSQSSSFVSFFKQYLSKVLNNFFKQYFACINSVNYKEAA